MNGYSTLEHMQRVWKRKDDGIRETIIEWRLISKTPRGRSGKRWLDGIKDPEKMGNIDWEECIRNRERWNKGMLITIGFSKSF